MASEDDERLTLAAALKRAMSDRVGAPIGLVVPSTPKPTPCVASADAVRADHASPPDVGGPMSFTTPLLRAILDGHKTQTRRPVRPAPTSVNPSGVPLDAEGVPIEPLARPGGRLWIRESCARAPDGSFIYAVDGPTPHGMRMNPARFMPREAARTVLTVRSVEVAKLSTITDADALAEGAGADLSATMFGARHWFLALWDSIYGETEFASANDPWVWVIAFELDR